MTPVATEEHQAVTERLPATHRPSRGPRGLGPRLHALGAPLRPYGTPIAIAAIVAAIVALAVTGQLNLFSGTSATLGPPPGIITAGSSWVTGEPSLADSPLFASIENRAATLGNARWAARQALIAEIAAAKRAAAARRRSDLLKKYAELRAKELAAYHAALLRIERLRAEQAAKLAAERKKYAEELAAYMRARTVTPGQECNDPQVAKYYSCQNGLLPAGPQKANVKQTTPSKGH